MGRRKQRYKNLTTSKDFERLRAESQRQMQSEEGEDLWMNRSSICPCQPFQQEPPGLTVQ